MAYVVHDDPTETSAWTALVIVLAIVVVAFIGYVAWSGPHAATALTPQEQTQQATPGPTNLGTPGATGAGPQPTAPNDPLPARVP